MDVDPTTQDTEAEEPPPPMKTRTVRLVATPDASTTLRRWFGSARWTYNACVRALKDRQACASLRDLRAYAVNDDSPAVTAHPWLKETPYDVRDDAVRDLIKAYKALRKQGKAFDLKFRSRKDASQSITIHHKHWKHKRGAYTELFAGVHATEALPDVPPPDGRLTRNRLGQYHLKWPVPLDVRGENQAPDAAKHATIALDPGVRTFMTGYDADGRIVEWGRNDVARLGRLCHAYDSLQARWAKEKHARRHRMQRVGRRIQLKIKHLVADLHRRLAKWLCTHYRVVLIPVFETQQMVQRSTRRIRSKTARAMLTWSHYAFRQFLLHKSREYPWCKIVVVTEEYTSKTCGGCGALHAKLGGSKVFKCPACGFTVDRDANGARNILLKFLTERAVGLPCSAVA